MGNNAEAALLPAIHIKFNGSALEASTMHQLSDATIDNSIYVPGMFSLSFYDPEYKVLGLSAVKPGTAVVIEMGYPNALTKVFEGEIAAVEPFFSGSNESPVTVIRGYDRAYHLHTARSSKTYVQVTDSDIVSTIARAAGLSAQCGPTSDVRDYVLQHDQTDWEFLQVLAARNGFAVRVDGQKLLFKKPGDLTGGQPVTLGLGDDLIEFRPRLSVASQYDSVQVRDWDHKQKQAIVGEASSPDSFPHPSTNGHSLATTAGYTSALTVTMVPVGSQGEANAVAKAVLTNARFGDIQAEGVAFLNAKIAAGGKVKIEKLPAAYAGEYLATRVQHAYSASAGIMRTRFEATTVMTATAAQLMAGARHGAASGLVAAPAIVTNVQDNQTGEKFGSVKVKFPWMRGDQGAEIESNWMRLVGPGAGASRGVMFMPEVNDEVAVLFDRGSPERGFVLGGLWNGKDATPVTMANLLDGQKIKVREIKTRMGSVLRFTDDAAGTKIEIIDKSGKNSIVIEEQSNKITIKSDMDVTVETKTVNVKGTQQINIDGGSSAPVNVKGSQIKVEGTTVEVKATGTLKVEATGPLEVKSGAMTTIDGGPMLMLKGGLVKIN